MKSLSDPDTSPLLRSPLLSLQMCMVLVMRHETAAITNTVTFKSQMIVQDKEQPFVT